MRGDFDDLDREDEEEDEERPRMTRRGRTYIHPRCRGGTFVSGRDYQRISDPFAMVPSTYCCGCNGFVSLSDIRWADTNENVGAYRRRMRSLTPGVIQAWRYGLGVLPGMPVGAVIGLIIALLTTGLQRVDVGLVVSAVVVGALVVGVVGYFVGSAVLNSVYKIDYRLMR